MKDLIVLIVLTGTSIGFASDFNSLNQNELEPQINIEVGKQDPEKETNAKKLETPTPTPKATPKPKGHWAGKIFIADVPNSIKPPGLSPVSLPQVKNLVINGEEVDWSDIIDQYLINPNAPEIPSDGWSEIKDYFAAKIDINQTDEYSRAMYYFAEGQLLINNNVKAAIIPLTLSVNLVSESFTYRALAKAHLKNNNLKLAEESYQKSLDLNDNDALSWAGLGDIYASKDPRKAEGFYLESKKRGLLTSEFRLKLLKTQVKLKRKNDLPEIIPEELVDSEQLVTLADIYEVLKNPQMQINALRRAVELNFDSAKFRFRLAHAYLEIQEFQFALNEVQSVLKLDPTGKEVEIESIRKLLARISKKLDITRPKEEL